MTPWRVASAVLGIALVLIYAGGANYWNRQDGWYQSLQQPSWQPPGFVFGIVWPYNFVVIGIALCAIASQAKPWLVAASLIFFAASVFFALRWSYLFYAEHSLSQAAAALLVAAILTMPIFAITWTISWRAAIAFIPYQIWIFIAAALSRSYVNLN
jgi:tryptophan-rich sensory protein